MRLHGLKQDAWELGESAVDVGSFFVPGWPAGSTKALRAAGDLNDARKAAKRSRLDEVYDASKTDPVNKSIRRQLERRRRQEAAERAAEQERLRREAAEAIARNNLEQLIEMVRCRGRTVGLDVKVVYDTVKKRIVSGYPTNVPRNP